MIPLHQWHFRTADEHVTPVLNDLIDYQHRACLAAMTANRDQWNDVQRWTTTALSFASSIHPPKDESYCSIGLDMVVTKASNAFFILLNKLRWRNPPIVRGLTTRLTACWIALIWLSLLCTKLQKPNKSPNCKSPIR
jgi:hypothetical protein